MASPRAFVTRQIFPEALELIGKRPNWRFGLMRAHRPRWSLLTKYPAWMAS